MKRVVTGHDAQGRSVFVIEDAPEAVVLEKAGGLRLTELWATPSETRARRIEPAIPHLSGELFAQSAKVRLTVVHYRGAGPALNDLLAGQVQMIFVGLGVVRSHMAAGTVRVLAVSQSERLSGAPEIPTAAEAGLPGFELNTWFGIVAPKGTPERVIATLAREIHAMQDDPSVRKRLAESGLDVLKESPGEFRARMLRDHERFHRIVQAAGLKAE
jgi:tripartite-type tricarboxylate transporter receptor subunit TctC